MRAMLLFCGGMAMCAGAFAQGTPRGSDFATQVQPPSALPAAAGLSTGQVLALDERRRRITLRHEGVRALALPAGDTVFELADAAVLRRLKVGDLLAFAAERAPGGVLVITRSQGGE